MLTNDYQERNKVIRLSYLFKLLDGLSTGLYLLIYTSIIGHISFHHQQILNPLSFGALYVLLLFVQEYFLEIWGGAVGDKFGSLTAIKGGITCRIAFFILLATMVLFKESSIVFYITLLLSSLTFSLSFTLFSGNIEKFLFSGIKIEPLKENNFFRQDSISDFIRGLGILFGAIFSYYILILK
jgi:MFS family permease